MIPDRIWPGIFQAEAGRGNTASVRSASAINDTRLSAMPYPMSKGQEKCSGHPAMNRSKQAGMARKTIIVVWLIALALVSFRLADAQQHEKLPKIRWLGARPTPGSGTGSESLLGELRKLGYVEGNNIAIESRYADNKLDRLPALADELVRLKVDVLLTPSTPAALAAKNATRTIPIVFLSVVDPVGVGLVDSLARPGE